MVKRTFVYGCWLYYRARIRYTQNKLFLTGTVDRNKHIRINFQDRQ